MSSVNQQELQLGLLQVWQPAYIDQRFYCTEWTGLATKVQMGMCLSMKYEGRQDPQSHHVWFICMPLA